ncbi:MAG: hypothetical protein K0S80_5302 [Neobacillus sp.]|nr:hypothetical protein [Neobacillus sp.]
MLFREIKPDDAERLVNLIKKVESKYQYIFLNQAKET